MKKITQLLTLSLLIIAGALNTGCNTPPAQKVANAQNDVNNANKALEEANKELMVDVDNYRKASTAKIAENEKSISDFKMRVEAQKQSARAEYQMKITDLEKKNTDLKKKMDDYKIDNKEKWESFKTEFNHDLDELGEAFKGFGKNDVKH